VWLDQADGQVLTEGEEVTLMDWGNAIIKVGAETVSSAFRPHELLRQRFFACADRIGFAFVSCSHWFMQLPGCMAFICRSMLTACMRAVLLGGVFVCGRWFCGWMPADDHIALIGDAAGLALAAMVHLEKRY
jgi:hypothetical protein